MQRASGMCRWTCHEAHSLDPALVLQRVQSSEEGLSQQEAAFRLEQCGPNQLITDEGKRFWQAAWDQLRSPLIWVLLLSAALAASLGRPADSVVIALVVLCNILIGTVQQWRANAALSALTELIPHHCLVIREAERCAVKASELVPGDLVHLSAGDQVPADLRLIRCQGLRVSEAALTGESVPVDKSVEAVTLSTPLAERSSALFSGSLVVAGTATGVVVATAAATELGRISTLLASVQSPETPLTRQLHRFGQRLTLWICLIAVILLLIGLWRGVSLLSATLSAISLAVAAIPEGLPALITMILAVGVHRMAHHQAVVKDLPAVEALGSTTVICTDKTGTLTQNLMAVRRVWAQGESLHVEEQGYAPHPPLFAGEVPARWKQLALACALCNNAELIQEEEGQRRGHWSCRGDPTEGALLSFARRCGVHEPLHRELTRVAELPFDSDTRLMAVRVKGPEGFSLWVKGSLDALLSRSVLDSHHSEALLQQSEKMAAAGWRVLACATQPEGAGASTDLHPADLTLDQIHSLQIVGLVALEDPPRPEARAAIARCHSAGIRVKMITGDHPLTAAAIAQELGLTHHLRVVTGSEMATLSAHELQDLAQKVDLYARISPEQKLRLIEALQARHEIVAMTGDGVNDAPALRQADVGVSMGRGGTAVAREASDLVLLDDRFATIEQAVEEGRRIYDTIVKSLAFLLPTSFGLALILAVGIQFMPIREGQLQLPLEPLQVLWINLVAAIFLSLPLAFEPAEPHLMEMAPRPPHAPLFTRRDKIKALVIALLVASSSFACFAVSLLLLEHPLEQAQTLALQAVILIQTVALLDARSSRGSMWTSLRHNRWIGWGIGVLAILQILITYTPALQRLFHTAALGQSDLLILAIVTLLSLLLAQLHRRWG